MSEAVAVADAQAIKAFVFVLRVAVRDVLEIDRQRVVRVQPEPDFEGDME